MGRNTEGHKITWKRGWAYVRFTWDGQAHFIALRTQDPQEANEAAARAYAQVVGGERRAVKASPRTLLELDQLLQLWVKSKESSVDPSTLPTLDIYIRRYFDYFKKLDNINETTTSTYGLDRLAQVLRTSIMRELMYLRQFLAWAKLHGAINHVPHVPKLPPKALGIRAGKQRAKSVAVTPTEAKQIIELLPETSKKIDERRWPLRARFAFMWETALRPETLSRLRVPENWQPGWKHLELTDEDDKARFGREVDLTPKAIAILTEIAPVEGFIFGGHNYSKALKKAAKAILGARRGKSFAPYDFRHGRAKERLDAGASLRGVAYMLGHKRMSTTDKYLAPDRAAGRDALEK